MEGLTRSLKKMVITECNVPGVSPDQVGDQDQIIAGEGALKLDSLDAVEIVAALDRHLGLKIDSAGDSRKIFKSFTVLSEYVLAHSEAERLTKFISQHN